MPSRWMPAWVTAPFAGRPLLGRLAGNVGWLVFERIAPMLTGFIVNAVVVRYMGPERFGLYSYALSFASIFATLATVGTEAIVVRELARTPDREGEIIGTALVMRLAAAGVVWVAAVVAVAYLRDDPLTRVLVAIMAGNALATALAVFECWFRAQIAAREMVIARTTAVMLGQAGRVVLVLVGASLPAFAVLTAGTAVLSSVLVWILFARKTAQKLRWDGGRARQLVRDSWPLVIVSISIMVYMKIDQVMLTAMTSDRENGIYATAVTLSELWYFLPVAIGGTVFPLIVQAHESEDEVSFNRKLQLFYDAMVALGYAIAVPVFVLAGPIVQILFGSAYQQSAAVLRVHVASFVFVCIGMARGQFIMTKNYNKFGMVASVSAAALNVVLNVVLIRPYGALGAAWSTLISYAAANYLSGLCAPSLWTQTWMLTRSLTVPLRVGELWRGLTHVRD